MFMHIYINPPYHTPILTLTYSGTGASAIYSLLATSLRPRWTMHGTEIDSKSFAYARRNIALNNLTSRIHAHLSPSPEAPLIPFEKLSEGAEDSRRLDFTMCNPPFYSSVEDLATSKTFKSQKPTAICTGADIEMICEGGDIGFVLHMLDESLILRDKIQWYTSMLGKLSSAYTLVTRLKEGGISNWAVSSLRKNGKTKRWVVGWSFGDRRPRWDVCCDGDIPAALLPQTTVMSVRTSPLMGKEVEDTLNASLDALDLDWTWNGETRTGVGSARGNVWSRSARRKRKRDEVEHSPTDKPTNSENRKVDSDTVQSGSDKKMVDTSKEKGEEIALAFKISFSSGSTSSVMALPETSAPTGTKVTNDDSVTNNETVEAGDMQIRWLQGHDWGLFESFSGMLRRAITVQVNLRTQETDKAKSGS